MRRRSRLQKQGLRASETRKRKIAGQVVEINKSFKASVDAELEGEERRLVATVKKTLSTSFLMQGKRLKQSHSSVPWRWVGKY